MGVRHPSGPHRDHLTRPHGHIARRVEDSQLLNSNNPGHAPRPGRTDDLATAEPKGPRQRLLHIAAKLVRHGRRTHLKLDGDWPWSKTLAAAFELPRTIPALCGARTAPRGHDPTTDSRHDHVRLPETDRRGCQRSRAERPSRPPPARQPPHPLIHTLATEPRSPYDDNGASRF
jgi:hypothetical protein